MPDDTIEARARRAAEEIYLWDRDFREHNGILDFPDKTVQVYAEIIMREMGSEFYRSSPEEWRKGMATDLKPCPLCGSKAGLIGRKNGGGFGEIGVVCYNPECKAGFLGAISPNEARIRWNRRTPDHIPDARKMIDPMTSVVTWTRYDGTPETLPEEERPVCFSGVKERVAILFEGVWFDYFDDFISHPTPGDMWAPMPTPPEAAQ